MEKLFSDTIGKGPDIVLLHGWGLHSGIWQFVADKLAKDFRVTVIDLPGFGRSKLICDFSMESLFDQLLSVAPKKAIWIGWSLGGLIATHLAISIPQCVTRLICVASSPRFVKIAGWPGMDMAILQDFCHQLQSDYQATLMRFLLLQFYGYTIETSMRRWLRLNLFLYGKPPIQALLGSLEVLVKTDLREQLADIKCPILYMLGKMDKLVPYQIGATLRQLRPDIQVTILKQAGHGLFLSHEAEFIEKVKQFSYE